jgi:predicted ABC-type ATPase
MPNLIVIAGPNGSGKSTTAPKLLRDTLRVDESVVRRRYERSMSNFFNIYRPVANSWLMLDNSSTDAPSPIAWRNVDGPLQIVKTGPWNRFRNLYEKDSFPPR